MEETDGMAVVVVVETDLGEVDDQLTENFKTVFNVYSNDQFIVRDVLVGNDIVLICVVNYNCSFLHIPSIQF